MQRAKQIFLILLFDVLPSLYVVNNPSLARTCRNITNDAGDVMTSIRHSIIEWMIEVTGTE